MQSSPLLHRAASSFTAATASANGMTAASASASASGTAAASNGNGNLAGSPLRTASMDGSSSVVLTGNSADVDLLSTARKHYVGLQDLLGQLSSKLSNVSTQVDREFLSSYRVHMQSIRSEVHHLKQEIARSEQRLNDDVTVARLESEAKWFQEECQRLRFHFDAMQSDVNQMKERLQGMSEQKHYLATQLKALVKRNRVLQDALQETLPPTTLVLPVTAAASVSSEEKRAKGSKKEKLADEIAKSIHSAQSVRYPAVLAERAAGESRETDESSQQGKEKKRPKQVKPSFSQNDLRLGSPQRLQLPRITKSNRHSQSQPLLPLSRATSRRTTCMEDITSEDRDERYRQALQDLHEHRLEVEEELEDSLVHTFEQIRRRRRESAANNSRFGEGADVGLVLAGGVSGLGLQYFSNNDRLAAMIHFLSKPAILEEVVRLLADPQSSFDANN